MFVVLVDFYCILFSYLFTVFCKAVYFCNLFENLSLIKKVTHGKNTT